ncbi:ABC transporter ATP-binding protein [Mesobacillus harenae]|uniref:ABC transporter ATP-binding protein n=1 Tax=Mesobacillus harenae TaxID=2213203 RepID=UPI001580415E|nr:ABC transporter ATP-binding protein [Mesobacillus harenae]
MIRFEKVNKTYDDGFEAVKSLSFEISKGELVTFIGPSGCGKTTTMKMINKLIDPTSGTIYVDGENITQANGVELRRNIGYVIQQIGLLPHMTIAENIALIPKLKGWHKDRYEKRVDELLDMVGLEPSQFRSKYPLELSGGQQQRVGVIRALAAEPPIILMDEPFSALDPISREQLQDELKEIQHRIQKTIVFVTHDIDEALKLADRIAVMKDGRIVQFDTPEALVTSPANEFIRDFIGESRLKEVTSTIIADLLEADTAIIDTGGNHSGHQMSPDSLLFASSSDDTYAGAFFEGRSIHNYPSILVDADLKTAATLFLDQKIEVLPVLNEDQLVGLLTRDRLLQHFAGLGKEGARS